jgi:hypothetical protein
VPEASPIVHVGFPKTASTWFQGAFYPHVRNPRYIERPRVNAAFLEANALTFDPAEARRTLGLGQGEAGILCEEGLCGYLHNGGVLGRESRAVAEQICAALPDARIVIFIRSQPEILVAAYQQYVRSGGTYGARRYFFPGDYLISHNAIRYKQPRFDIDFFRYAPLVEQYERLFGRERVHVFLFEQFRRGGMDWLRDYARRLELDVDWEAVSLAPRLSSYGMPLTYFARLLALFTARSVMDKRHLIHIPGLYKARRRMLEMLNRRGVFGAPPTLERLVGAATARWLENHYAEDNRRLAEMRGLPLADFGYPMVSGEALERPRPGRWRRLLAA